MKNRFEFFFVNIQNLNMNKNGGNGCGKITTATTPAHLNKWQTCLMMNFSFFIFNSLDTTILKWLTLSSFFPIFVVVVVVVARFMLQLFRFCFFLTNSYFFLFIKQLSPHVRLTPMNKRNKTIRHKFFHFFSLRNIYIEKNNQLLFIAYWFGNLFEKSVKKKKNWWPFI